MNWKSLTPILAFLVIGGGWSWYINGEIQEIHRADARFNRNEKTFLYLHRLGAGEWSMARTFQAAKEGKAWEEALADCRLNYPDIGKEPN